MTVTTPVAVGTVAVGTVAATTGSTPAAVFGPTGMFGSAAVVGTVDGVLGAMAAAYSTAAGLVNTAEGIVVATAVSGGAGVMAGAAARRLLAVLRRGARVRPPVCELATGALWVVTGCLWGAGLLPSAWLPALLGLGWLGVAAGLVDLRHRRLPDALTVPAACVAPLGVLPLGGAAVGRGLLGALAAAVGYGIVHLLRPTALGAGDVKLAVPLGALLGAASWAALATAAVLAAVITGAVGLVVACVGRAPPGATVPHGPSMLMATWLVVLVAAVGGTG